jgi:hypothetical protein
MPSTYTLISSNVLTTSAASVTFSAIPSTYTDLVLRTSIKNNRNLEYTAMKLTFNGLSTSIYSWRYTGAEGSTLANDSSPATTYMDYPRSNGNNAGSANLFSNDEMYLPNYTSSAKKPISIVGVQEYNNTVSNMIKTTAGLIDITTAITSITIAPQSATYNLLSDSSFYLYGIKNS